MSSSTNQQSVVKQTSNQVTTTTQVNQMVQRTAVHGIQSGQIQSTQTHTTTTQPQYQTIPAHVTLSPTRNVGLTTMPITSNVVQTMQPIPSNITYQIQGVPTTQYIGTHHLVERKVPIVQTVREVVVTNDNSARIKELQLLISRLYQEIQMYQVRVTEYETTTITTQTLETKVSMLIEQNNALQRNIGDFNLLNSKYQESLNTIKYYESEHSKWQEFINIKTNETEVLKQQISQIEYAYKQLQLADAQKQARIDDLTGNLDLTRKSHLENVKRSQTVTRKRIETLEEELREIKRNLDQANIEIQNWHGKYLQSQNEKQEYAMRNSQLEEKLNSLTQELQRILTALQNQSDQNEAAQKKISQLQTLNFKIQTLQAEISHYKEVITSREREIEDWRQRYSQQIQLIEDLRQTNASISEYENQAVMMSSEMERLHLLIKSQQDELDSLQQSIYQYEITINQYKSIEQDKIQLENKVALLAQEIQRLSNINNKRIQEIDQYQIRISQLDIEISSLTTYQGEVSRLREYIELRNREYEELRRKYQNLEIDYSGSQSQIRELENKIAMLSTELERLSSLNNSKYDQLQEWKRKCLSLETTITSYQTVEEENRRLREFLELTKQERDSLRQRITKLERESLDWGSQRTQLENKVAILSTEVQRLLSLVNDRNKSIDNYRSQIVNLQSEISRLKYSETRIQEGQVKINILTSELQRISNAYRSKCDEYDQLTERYRRLEIENSQIGVFQSDNNRLREIIEQLQREIQDNREQIFKLEQVISELRRYEQMKIQLENQIAMLSTELQRQDNIMRTRNEELENLQRKIQQLELLMYQIRDYEEQNKILSQEIDRLSALYRESEDELRTWRFKYAEVNELQNQNQELLVQLVIANSLNQTLAGQVRDSLTDSSDFQRSSLTGSNKFR